MPRGAGEIYSLAKQYAELGKKGAYIIADKFIADKYHDEVISSFEKSGTPYKLVVFGGECSRAEIEKHCHNLVMRMSSSARAVARLWILPRPWLFIPANA